MSATVACALFIEVLVTLLLSAIQPSMTDVAKGILSKMGTEKFRLPDESWSSMDVDTCAVCLDEYLAGQVCQLTLTSLCTIMQNFAQVHFS